MSKEMEFNSRQMARNVIFSTEFRQGLKHAKAVHQWVPDALSPGVKRAGE
jgi:hypothetical protein